MNSTIEIIKPDLFDSVNHFYPKALNCQMHPIISYFLSLDHKRIIQRYQHLNPKVDAELLKNILEYSCKHFYWGGADLFYVTTEYGERKLTILETNSCPSGQKSMPPFDDIDEHRGYMALIAESFLPSLKGKRLIPGALAVIYDKNYMEASGYAAALSELTGENVYLILYHDIKNEDVYFDDGILYVKSDDEIIPIRAAIRYVTQKPWNRIPLQTKTFIYNSTLVCISGGRNKLIASKAYELYNSELNETGLQINVPETIRDVGKIEVPIWVQKFGGYAVVKVPYSNAGQGVYTITTQEELDKFMSIEHEYDQFIVQSLIGHYNWSSHGDSGKYYHIGTIPNKKGHIYVSDIRMMVYSTPKGFKPVAIYARRAKKPLVEMLDSEMNSWDVLGTNLSFRNEKGEWDTDTSRLMLMDRKDFNSLGISIDDLIEAYIQTILSIISIDKMSSQLVTAKGKFRKELFKTLDNDPALIEEMLVK